MSYCVVLCVVFDVVCVVSCVVCVWCVCRVRCVGVCDMCLCVVFV